MKYRNIYENTNKNHFAFEWHFRWYFAIFIMIIFVSVKLPDAHNIKVNSMFILCWGGHALIQIFYILSLSIPLHLMNFLSTVGLLIRKCFANSIHSTSSHWRYPGGALKHIPNVHCTLSLLLCTSCWGYCILDLPMKSTAFTFSTTHLHSTVQ